MMTASTESSDGKADVPRASFISTRLAALCAAICSIVACIPPNSGVWPSPPPQGNVYDYDEHSHHDDEEYVEDGSRDTRPSAEAPVRERGPAPTSPARSRGTTWHCRAQATVTRSNSVGPVDSSSIDTMHEGRTRDEASVNAANDCRSQVTTQLLIFDTSDTEEGSITSPCRVTQCWAD